MRAAARRVALGIYGARWLLFALLALGVWARVERYEVVSCQARGCYLFDRWTARPWFRYWSSPWEAEYGRREGVRIPRPEE